MCIFLLLTSSEILYNLSWGLCVQHFEILSFLREEAMGFSFSFLIV